MSRSSTWYCDLVVIALNKSALHTLLLLAAANGASPSSDEAEVDLIELSIEARVQRLGRSVRFGPHSD